MKSPRFAMTMLNQYSSRKTGGDLAVMSIEAYEELIGRFELYGLLQDGMDDVAVGNTKPLSEAIEQLRRRRN